MNQRTEIAKQLAGTGIEIGPGLDPIKVPEETHVIYIDKPLEGGYAQAHGLSAQAETSLSMERDIDKEGMHWIRDLNADFVIACHLIEHLANPIRFIKEAYDSLPIDGKLLLVVPDRQYSFDFGRDATHMKHLLEEYYSGCDEVDDQHIRAELAHSLGLSDLDNVPLHEIDKWRELTVHAHCWTGPEFIALISTLIHKRLCNWTLEASYWPESEGVSGFEFGLLLKKVEPQNFGFESFIKSYLIDVVCQYPGERARWTQFINYMSEEFNNFGLPKSFNPEGLLPIFIEEFQTVEDSHGLFDNLRIIERLNAASATPNSPFGIGRVAAYWRGYQNSVS
jgi:hypothetical protein